MDMYTKLNQLDFFIQNDFSFANTVCLLDTLPNDCVFTDEAIKLANYNNHEKGIIDKSFFGWALKEDISYEAMRWFVEDFSGQNSAEITSLVKSLFKNYHIYLDESCNPIKFKLKNDMGETNSLWFDDFTLAGVVLDANCELDIDALFDSLCLQKNVIDAKLSNIAKYKGDESNRLISILDSQKISILLDTLNSTNGVYIHWSTQSLWYYSLVDLVDSSLEIPFMGEEVKNALFTHAMGSPNFFTMLAEYNYPNICDGDVEPFCNDMIQWIESLAPADEYEDFGLECLRQGIKSSRRFNNLVYLKNNKDRVLIEDFVANYALRLAQFPQSVLTYDEYSVAQENIGKYEKVYCTEKVPTYSFASSTNNKMMQIADFIAGLTSALMAYVNTHDKKQIDFDFGTLTDVQHYNLREFLKLRLNSSRHNIYFDNMSRNHMQIERIRYLMSLEHVN